jgi:hypothetical protein
VTERTPFELATGELRKLGITLRQLPGEFSVNFRDGNDATARTAETLEDAVELGRDMAKTLAPATTSTATPGKRYRHPRRMTPKGQRRRMIRLHNRRMRVEISTAQLSPEKARLC